MLEKTREELLQDIEDYKVHIESLKSDIKEYKREISDLEDTIDDMEERTEEHPFYNKDKESLEDQSKSELLSDHWEKFTAAQLEDFFKMIKII